MNSSTDPKTSGCGPSASERQYFMLGAGKFFNESDADDFAMYNDQHDLYHTAFPLKSDSDYFKVQLRGWNPMSETRRSLEQNIRARVIGRSINERLDKVWEQDRCWEENVRRIIEGVNDVSFIVEKTKSHDTGVRYRTYPRFYWGTKVVAISFVLAALTLLALSVAFRVLLIHPWLAVIGTVVSCGFYFMAVLAEREYNEYDRTTT